MPHSEWQHFVRNKGHLGQSQKPIEDAHEGFLVLLGETAKSIKNDIHCTLNQRSN
jgi:hypothetical protein